MPQFRDFESTNAFFPDTVFFFLNMLIREKDPVLDLGCGSGTTTRQLAKKGFQDISALDTDIKLLDEARENPTFKQIGFFRLVSKKLPFKSNFFKGITCFSSFEPYTDNLSLYEIRRVLKRQGILFIATKKETSGVIEDLRNLFQNYLNIELIQKKPFIIPQELLKAYSLIKEPLRTFDGENLYSLEAFLHEIKREPFWEIIPEEKKDELLEKVAIPYLEPKMVFKRITIKYTVICEIFRKA